jgi:hypothetical protein
VKRVRALLMSPAFIFAVALVLRLSYLAAAVLMRRAYPHGYVVVSHETGRIAVNIAQGHGFSSPLKVYTGPTAWLTPIYPYLLAGVLKVFGIFTVRSEIAIKTLNNLFSALVCLPLFAIGRRVFGTAVGAAAAWLWVCSYTAFFWPTSWIWDTSLSALALTLLLWATCALDDQDGAAGWAGYGGLWAFGTLVNAAVLSTFPGLLAYAAYRARKRGAPWLRLTGVAVLLFTVGISPWIIRNQIVFHGKVWLRSNFGLELWLGNNPEVPDTWTWWRHPNDNDAEGAKFARMGELAYMQEKKSAAIEFIKTHPVDVARFQFHRFMENWTGTDDPIADVFWRLPLWAQAMLFWNCSFSLLAWIGLVCARRAEPLRCLPILVVFLFFPVIYYVTHNTPRYRHPMEPAMALLAVYAVAYPLKVWREKRERQKVSVVAVEMAS